MSIRSAIEEDLDAIIALIRGLAEYEREPEAVRLERGALREHLFGARPFAEVLMAEDADGTSAGFALFFHNYSTWEGKPGIWLEELFVLPERRGRGHGKALLQAIARIAIARGCGRFEWSVLDWNAPSIGFYKALGARPMSEWTTYRVDGAALAELGAAEAP
jgi:GNAT superfamily N-acetyltransferase